MKSEVNVKQLHRLLSKKIGEVVNGQINDDITRLKARDLASHLISDHYPDMTSVISIRAEGDSMSPQTINLVPKNIPTALFMMYGIADPFLPADLRVYEIPDLGIYLELTDSGDVITRKERSLE